MFDNQTLTRVISSFAFRSFYTFVLKSDTKDHLKQWKSWLLLDAFAEKLTMEWSPICFVYAELEKIMRKFCSLKTVSTFEWFELMKSKPPGDVDNFQRYGVVKLYTSNTEN